MSIEVWANEGPLWKKTGRGVERNVSWKHGGGYWINQVKTGEKSKSSFLFTKEKVKV